MDALLEPAVLAGHERFVLGVSGGGDSMALLHLMHAAGHDCIAVTVDHRLREGSADDAAFVARACAQLGVPHRAVARPGKADWHNQRAAREGRYDALLAVAVEVDAPIVLAHTLDDQAETVRMRARRGGGTLGLSGIPPIATLAGTTRTLRPLLNATRDELRSSLVDAGRDWIDDPSNEDLRFERVRARMSADAGEMRALGRFAAAARRHRAAIMRIVAADLRENLRGHGRSFSYEPELAGTPLVHAVRIVAAWLGRADTLPAQARVAAFLSGEPAITIAGAVIRKRGRALVFHVEDRRAASFHHDPERRSRTPLDRFRPASDDPVHAVLSELSP